MIPKFLNKEDLNIAKIEFKEMMSDEDQVQKLKLIISESSSASLQFDLFEDQILKNTFQNSDVRTFILLELFKSSGDCQKIKGHDLLRLIIESQFYGF